MPAGDCGDDHDTGADAEQLDDELQNAGAVRRERDALRIKLALVRDRVRGLPDHPWIPGYEFADGKLFEALGLEQVGPIDNATEIRRRALEPWEYFDGD